MLVLMVHQSMNIFDVNLILRRFVPDRLQIDKNSKILNISLPKFSFYFRRMFPTVRVSFSGLMRPSKPSDFYAVLLDIVPVDSRRYRYAYHRSAWLVAGKADPPPPPRLHAHPDTPFSFEALTKQVISFEKAKLTNNELDRNGQVSF